MIRSFFILILIIGFSSSLKSNEIVKQDLYKKIDLFGEVLDKIQSEYVDQIDQADVMDSAIN